MKTPDRASALRELIRKMERKLGILGKSELSCCGVTMAQCHALVEIGRAGAITLKDLADIIRLDITTLSRTVDNLARKKIVKRKIDPEDRRCVRIALTDKGTQIYENIEENMETYYQKVLRNIPENKQDQVLECLDLLLDALNQNPCC